MLRKKLCSFPEGSDYAGKPMQSYVWHKLTIHVQVANASMASIFTEVRTTLTFGGD